MQNPYRPTEIQREFLEKYYLNMKRYDKIQEIIKEKGNSSIIPILLML